MSYDLLIAGGGPAGLTAGIYAARGGLKTAIITGLYKGGKTSLVSKIENYSGIIDINGFKLTSAMHEQAVTSGVEFIDGEVKEYRLTSDPKKLILDSGKEFSSKYIILSMGTYNKKLGLPNEEKLLGQGIAYCASCDAMFYKDKVVAVCGGGNSALTDALYLSNVAKQVYLIHKRNTFKASNVLVQRAKAIPKIKIIMESAVVALEGEPLSGISIENVTNRTIRKLDVSGLFIAIGSLPNSQGVKEQVSVDDTGYIVTDENMQTNIENVFAAGDIRVTPLRQIITACADGAIAADAAVRKSLGRL